MRRRLAALVVGLAASVAACASPGPSNTSTAPTSTTLFGPPPALPQSVIDTVLSTAAQAGDRTTPLRARYAYGTRRQALHGLSMGELPPNQVDTKVFVVVVDGSFSLPDAYVPKGAPEPKGRYLVVVVDPDEPDGALDVGVTPNAPPLDRVGQTLATDLSPTTTAPTTPAAPS